MFTLISIIIITITIIIIIIIIIHLIRGLAGVVLGAVFCRARSVAFSDKIVCGMVVVVLVVVRREAHSVEEELNKKNIHLILIRICMQTNLSVVCYLRCI